MDESHELVQWLWAILENFTNAERVLFMRFVSGRSRLPANLADFSQRFQVMRVDRPLNGLPTAQTCFFQLRLPPYSNKVRNISRLDIILVIFNVNYCQQNSVYLPCIYFFIRKLWRIACVMPSIIARVLIWTTTCWLAMEEWKRKKMIFMWFLELPWTYSY